MREGESLFTASGCGRKRAIISASTVPSCERDGGGGGGGVFRNLSVLSLSRRGLNLCVRKGVGVGVLTALGSQ